MARYSLRTAKCWVLANHQMPGHSNMTDLTMGIFQWWSTMLGLLLFMAPLLWFGWSGYRKGFNRSLGPLLGWLVAYPVTFFYTRPLALWLQEHTELQGVAVYLVASAMLFGATCLAITLIFNRLTGKVLLPSLPSRLGGLGLGASLGVLVGLLLVYAFTLRPGAPQVTADNAPFVERKARQWLAQATATGLGLALQDKASGQLAQALVTNPQQTLNHAKALSNSTALQQFMQDPQLQQQLRARDLPGLRQQPAFRQLLQDEHMQAFLAQANIHGETHTQAAAERLATLLGQLEQLRQNPRLQAIVTDREFQQQLRDNNHLALLTNPRLNELLELIWAAPITQADTRLQVIEEGSAGAGTNSDGAIYRWVDDKGQVHYSDQPR